MGIDCRGCWVCAFLSSSFQPDFVLIRQHARDANDNWKHTILALHYGGLPGINSLQSVYNFLDKPWVVSVLAVVLRVD